MYSEVSSEITDENSAEYYIIFNLDGAAIRILLPAGGDPTINAFDFSWSAIASGTLFHMTMRLYSTGYAGFMNGTSFINQSSEVLSTTSSISIYKRN